MSFASEKPIKASEACALYGISRRTFDNWIAQGLRVRRMGKKLLYTTLEELERFSQPVEAKPVSPLQSQSSLCQVDKEAQELKKRFKL